MLLKENKYSDFLNVNYYLERLFHMQNGCSQKLWQPFFSPKWAAGEPKLWNSGCTQ